MTLHTSCTDTQLDPIMRRLHYRDDIVNWNVLLGQLRHNIRTYCQKGGYDCVLQIAIYCYSSIDDTTEHRAIVSDSFGDTSFNIL